MGMVSAGLATGNAVVLKPAEQAPACGYFVVKALREAGVPADALALLPGEGPGRRAAGRRPARAHDRVHRHRPGRAGDRQAGGGARARAAAPQARRGRDGREELRDRGLRRRPRRRRPRAGQVRVQLRGPEVLRGGAGARPRGDPRRAGRAARGRDRGAARRPGVRPRDRRAAGDRARGAGAGAALHRDRARAGQDRRAGAPTCRRAATSPRRRSPPTSRRTRPCCRRRSSGRCSRSSG